MGLGDSIHNNTNTPWYPLWGLHGTGTKHSQVTFSIRSPFSFHEQFVKSSWSFFAVDLFSVINEVQMRMMIEKPHGLVNLG